MFIQFMVSEQWSTAGPGLQTIQLRCFPCHHRLARGLPVIPVDQMDAPGNP